MIYPGTEDGTFVLNDIDLEIPPTNIQVRKESLTYQWRTLRTSVATKISSGHGNCVASVRIPWLDSQILTIHRFILELKNNPYCFIENQLIRDTLVPHWPTSQNMAFTVLGASLTRMADTSDGWLSELDLQWFNYAPFTPNFLYREDWVTVPIDTGNKTTRKGRGAGRGNFDVTTGQDATTQYSIGWTFNPVTGQRKPNSSVIKTDPLVGSSVQRWSQVKEDYVGRSSPTIMEMEQVHDGQVFDLLPLPGNMEPANFVSQPRKSRIYVRYINLLQRDALMENFGIDVEQDLIDAETNLQLPDSERGIMLDQFFGVVEEGKLKATHRLDSGSMERADIARATRRVQAKWAGQILSHHGQVKFVFDLYKEIRLPENLQRKLEKTRKTTLDAMQAQFAAVGGPASTGGQLYVPEDGYSQPLQTGFRHWQGKYTPIGSSIEEMLRMAPPAGSMRPYVRSQSTIEQIYSGGDASYAARKASGGTYEDLPFGTKHNRIHYGTDFTSARSVPVYAIMPGKVTNANKFPAFLARRWKYIQLSGTGTTGAGVPVGDRHSEWLVSLARAGLIQATSNGVNLLETTTAPEGFDVKMIVPTLVGYLVRDFQDPTILYYQDQGAGGFNIQIKHPDANGVSYSSYVHLKEIFVSSGQEITQEMVENRVPIGMSGGSSFYDAQKLGQLYSKFGNKGQVFNLRNANSLDPINDPDGLRQYVIGPHLHFEFWETLAEDERSQTIGAPVVAKTQTGASGIVVVDVVPGYQQAQDKSLSYITRPTVPEIVESASQTAVDEGVIDEDEQNSLVEIFNALDKDGWRYYDETNIQNIWRKTTHLQIQRQHHPASKMEQQRNELQALNHPNSFFVSDDCVLTNISANIRHIVANIPILGNEFPTQQHLGSIEPRYTLEFSCLDMTPESNLKGLGGNGRFLEGVRAALQSNARNFRLVQDSWTLLTDTLITRLFGTTKHYDWMAPQPGFPEAIKKRTIIGNADAANVEGNPGLSIVTWDLEETNPYSSETLVNTAPPAGDVDAKRAKILNALLKLEFKDGLGADVLPILIAQLAGADLTKSGKFSLNSAGTESKVYFDPAMQKIRVIDESGAASQVLDFFQIEYEAGKGGLAIPLDRFGAETNDDVGGLFGAGVNSTLQTMTGGEARESFVDRYGNALVADAYNGGRIAATIGAAPMTAAIVAKDWLTGTQTLNPEAASIGPSNMLAIASEIPGGITNHVANGVPLLDVDVSGALERHPELATIDFQAIMEGYAVLKQIMVTWQLLLAEEVKGGYSVSETRQQLFNLPGNNNMWASFQYYLQLLAKSDYKEEALTKNPQYFNSIPSGAAQQAIKYAYYNDWRLRKWVAPYEMAEALGEVVKAGWRGTAAGNNADWYKAQVDETRDFFIDDYIGAAFPLELAGSEWIEKVYQKHFAGLAGGIGSIGESTQLHFQFKRYLDSINILFRGNGLEYFSGNISEQDDDGISYPLLPGGSYGNAIIVSPGSDEIVRQNAGQSIGSSITDPLNEAISPGYLGPEGVIQNEMMVSNSSTLGLLGKYTGAALFGPFMPVALYAIWQSEERTSLGVIGGPAQYPTDKAAEKTKIAYLRDLLAEVADRILNEPDQLRAFGLEELAFAKFQDSYRGQEAYPDMKLPFHPYFETLYDVAPDFYMWSVYEDGQALGRDIQDQIRTEAGLIIDNAYGSMSRLQDGQRYDPNFGGIVSSVGADSLTPMVKMSAEGSDRGPYGATAFPYNPTPESAKAEKQFYAEWDAKNSSANANNEIHNNGVSSSAPPKHSDGRYTVKVGTTDHGMIYPSRIDGSSYTTLNAELQKHIDEVEGMFGNKAGYLGEQITEENVGDLKSRLNDTQAAQLDQYTHAFDPATLKKLADDSSRDIVSQKMTMRRAYPTFKLYFVEEDEQESRQLNFDDFYSYNGVKEFSYYESKRDSASTAVIVLQNVSGTLDGSVRNVVTDVDYFNRKTAEVAQEQNPDASVLSGDLSAQGTNLDQPFGAVALRPGMNVQLRCGYSNDPNALEVLLSGRVIDIAWNNGGDLVEVTVQSFGTELTQMLKGTGTTGVPPIIYHTTHQLLGALLLEPELQHFGRWKFGQHFQIGEAKGGFDFYDYAQDSYMGQFGWTESINKAVINHPILFAAAAVASVGALLLPWERIGGSMLKLIGRNTKLAGFTTKAEAQALVKGALQEVDNFAVVSGQAATRATRYARIEQSISSGLRTDIAEIIKKSPGILTKSLGEFRRAIPDAGVAFTDETVEILAGRLVAIEKEATLRAFSGRFLGVYGVPALSWGNYTSAGYTVGKNLLYTEMKGAVPLAASLAATGLTLDSINNFILRPIYNGTAKKLGDFFQRTKSTMFLSPQDDNIYPPSPKDYMTLGESWWSRYTSELVMSAGRVLFNSDVPGKLWRPEETLDKKLQVDQCQYVLSGSTIWDVFYEMTLRHPGWVYGARPYGRDFRYTMFFGIPSQRYWSKPVSNAFIERMNLLKTYLDRDGVITEAEYKVLYGATLEDGTTVEAYKATLEEGLEKRSVGPRRSSSFGRNQVPGAISVTEGDSREEIATKLQSTLTSRAMKEYLRGLELRFVPFRRYHFISSERDLVWNGIRTSEMNVINAVDVAYMPASGEVTELNMEATELIKASTAIPEYMLNVRPIQYPNCRGVTAAMRYGMGELLHTMKHMYNGEILVLGNPRIRPWDICILADSYNDITGPIEVEAVVHNFSFETGFTTEIKPGAVVIANEISAWPLLEGLKLWALAVKDMEQNFGGIGDGKGNLITTAADFINMYGAGTEFQSYIDEKYSKKLKGTGIEEIFGKQIPEQDTVNTAIELANTDVVGTLAEMARAGGRAALIAPIALTAGPIALIGALGTVQQEGLIKIPGVTVGASAFDWNFSGTDWTASTRASLKLPNLAFMIGSYVLLAKALREDVIMIIPLTKAGQPIVSGLSYKDPGSMWKSYRGEIRHYISDALDGTRDAVQDFNRYGTGIWRSALKALKEGDDVDLTRSGG